MDKQLAILLLLIASAHAQILQGIMNVQPAASSPIALDGTKHCFASSGASSVTTETCTLTSVTAGDLITCQGNDEDGGLASFSDATNGVYNFVLYEPEVNNPQVTSAIAYFANSASGTLTPKITVGTATTGLGIHCEAWLNARTTAVVEPSSAAFSQFNNPSGTSTTPTSGSTQTPTNAGELVYGALTVDSTIPTAPTAGTNYTLIDSGGNCSSFPTSDCQYPEYWIQTSATATNTPYTAASGPGHYSDVQTAFLPSSASAGVTPVTMFSNFEGSNGVAPTAATMAATSFGYGANVSGSWTCTNTHTDITFATAAQLSNLITSQWANGTLYNGSGSTGFKYATGSNGDGCKFTFGGGVQAVSIGFWTEWTIPNNDSGSHAYSMMTLENGGGADYMVMQLQPSGTVMQLRPECKFAVGANFTATVNTLYWITMTMQTNAGACTPGTNCALDTMKIYNSSGVLQNTSTCSSESGNNTIGTLIIGNTGAETQAAGDAIYFDDLVMNISSTSVGP